MQVLKRMGLYSSQIIETESRRAIVRGREEEEMVSYYCLMDTVSLRDEKFWRWMVVMTAQLCECTY